MPNLADLTPAFLDELSEAALRSDRRRMHYCIHADPSDPVQMMVNAVASDSYIRPHRHSLDPKVEHLSALRGTFACFVFDDAGEVLSSKIFGEHGDAPFGITLPPEAWHTVVALDDGAILLEVKQGPFRPELAKEPADWSPEEGTAEGAALIERLRAGLPPLS